MFNIAWANSCQSTRHDVRFPRGVFGLREPRFPVFAGVAAGRHGQMLESLPRNWRSAHQKPSAGACTQRISGKGPTHGGGAARLPRFRKATMTIGYGYGSEWHLLQYLGRRRDAFTRKIEGMTGVSSIRWLDHTESDASTDAPKVQELVGLEFLDPQHPARHEWERRWPSRGAVHNWDAVGQGLSHDHQTWILIEAKAHTGELKSSCGAKPESLRKIHKVLDGTQNDLQVTVETDWTQLYYQYCNRIALLQFLVKRGVNAHLTYVYFMGDRSDLGSDGRDCPANRQHWQEALAAQDRHVGIPADSPIRARIHRIFLPAYHAEIAERVLKAEYCRSGPPEGRQLAT